MIKRIFDWYLNFYPVRNCPLPKKVAIHVSYWILAVMVVKTSVLRSFSTEEAIAFFLVEISKYSILFYGIFYFVAPNLFKRKTIVLGILYLLLLHLLTHIIDLEYFKWAIDSNAIIKTSNFYKYAIKYIERGAWGLYEPINLGYEFRVLLNGTSYYFLLPFIRILSKYYVENVNLVKENAKLEINFLRTQLNPHFLLNSLNNIYSQAVTKDEATPDSIMVLSDLMKYILYHSGEQKVDLEREIHFIRNYIDLEKLKGNRFLKINYTEEGNTKDYQIAPLILVNFFENAFKHSGNHHGEVTTIDINIKCIDTTLYMSIKNDFLEENNPNIASKESGVGIENTIKRLNLLYPNRHNLTINKENGKFLVELMIRL